MDIKGKTFVVTGASDGIGKQVALRLAKSGANLALLGRNRERLAVTKKTVLRKGSKQVRAYPCDLRDPKKIKATVKEILHDFGAVDGLLNIAGIWQKIAPLEKISATEIDSVINTNLTGMIHLIRQLMPALKKRPAAAIINVSSKSGVVAQSGQSVYTASKYGVHGFTEVLKVELKGSNIRVAGVYQSGTNTKMFAKAGDRPPVRDFTRPEDLAEVIVFMLARPAKIWLHDVRVEY